MCDVCYRAASPALPREPKPLHPPADPKPYPPLKMSLNAAFEAASEFQPPELDEIEARRRGRDSVVAFLRVLDIDPVDLANARLPCVHGQFQDHVHKPFGPDPEMCRGSRLLVPEGDGEVES